MEKMVTGAKKIVCTCGFVVRSHDQREVAYFAVAHVRDKHKQELTLGAANGMMLDD
jgi:predicted small metal-binding protein